MENIEFISEKEFTYHWCGKFIAPDDQWIHMTRILSDYELIVMTEGELYISDGKNDYTVKAGEYLLMTPTPEQRGWKNSDCSFYWMHFCYDKDNNDHRIVEEGLDGRDPNLYISIPRQGRLSSFDRIVIMLKELQDSDRRSRNAVLNRYLCSAVLAELGLQGRMDRQEATRLKKEQTFNDIIDYISWHLSNPPSIRQIADYFGYNEKYLTTFFGRHAGMSLKQYMIQVRTEKAKALLTESPEKISQIAYELGFQDAHNFSNAFKKEVGMSPAAYRESYRMHNVFKI